MQLGLVTCLLELSKVLMDWKSWNIAYFGRKQARYRRHRFRVVNALYERLPEFKIDL